MWCSLLAMCSLTAWSQKSWSLDPFDGITVAGNFEVNLVRGDEERIVVEVRNAPQDEISIKVVRGELRIQLLNSLLYKNYDARITVYYQTLRSIRAQAGAKVRAQETLQGDQLELRASSGAQVELNLQVQAVEATAAEGGTLRLSGSTHSQRGSAVSGGQYEAFDLESQRTYARASLGGRIRVTALKMLEAGAHTGGVVEYKGDPAENNVRHLITGDIRKV